MNETRSTSTGTCHRCTCLATLLLSARLWAAEGNLSVPDLIALTTDLPKPAAITHYDILLRTDLDQNRLHLQTTCTVRS